MGLAYETLIIYIYSRTTRPRSTSAVIYFAATGFFGLLKSEDEGDDEKVPPSVKRQLLKAQRALRNEDYGGAERAYHDALKLLATSEHASTQPYIEARAVTLDKVSG